MAILTQPGDQTVDAPNPATFSVSVSGTPPISYQWRSNGVDIPGATSSSYMTGPTTVADDDGDMYRVLVSNCDGPVLSSVATLTVNNAAPTITMQPQDQTVTEPAMATLTVTATGTPPLSYQWLSNGMVIARATMSSHTTPATSVADDNNDTYQVVVSNPYGMVNSSVATLTVNAAGMLTTNDLGSSRAERAAIFWNETGSWGTVYLSPFQSQVSFRFGTRQVGNFPLYDRPVSIGSSFSITTSRKSGGNDQLFVNKTMVIDAFGKLPSIAGTQPTGNVGRGYNNNTFFAGDIAEIVVFCRALTPAERMAWEDYLDTKYGILPPPFIVSVANEQEESIPVTLWTESDDAGLYVWLTGQPGATYLLESSTDLDMWKPVATLTLPASGTASQLVESDGSVIFFRARLD